MTNDERAERAARALDYWRQGDSPEPETDARDFIADLCHWCDQQGLDPIRELRAGLLHYLPERDDPSCDGWMTEYEAEIYTRLVRDYRAA